MDFFKMAESRDVTCMYDGKSWLLLIERLYSAPLPPKNTQKSDPHKVVRCGSPVSCVELLDGRVNVNLGLF
jgi:hypothetical protein